jgi:hypothetical protein
VWRRRDAGLASAIGDGERSGRHRRRGQAAHLGARLGPMSCSLMVASARASCGGSAVDVHDAAGLTGVQDKADIAEKRREPQEA